MGSPVDLRLRMAKGRKAAMTIATAAASERGRRVNASTSDGAAVYFVASAAASGRAVDLRDSSKWIATATWKRTTWSMNAAAAGASTTGDTASRNGATAAAVRSRRRRWTTSASVASVARK